jgi:membrane protease YdiL (CAAX protease family)
MQDKTLPLPRASLWSRVPPVVRAAFVGLVVMGVGVQSWSLLAMIGLRLGVAWIPLVAAPVLLAVYWIFFSGRLFWPATKATRRESFRETVLSSATWIWGLAGALLFVVAFQSAVFTVFRLFSYPAEQFLPPGYVAQIPTAFLWPFVVMASLVAGICEETGFRGYMQRPLEARYGPAAAISITSLLFIAVHLDQAWIGALFVPGLFASVMLGVLAYASRSLIPSMIGHAVMDIFNFGYWWWQLLGTYNQRPITETGIDLNFLVWGSTLVISLSLFVFVVRKLWSVSGMSVPQIAGNLAYTSDSHNG